MQRSLIVFRFGAYQTFLSGSQKIMNLTGSKHSSGIYQICCNLWGKCNHFWLLCPSSISWVLGC